MRASPLPANSPLQIVPIRQLIVSDDGVSAPGVLAAPDMAAERRRAAALDRTHDGAVARSCEGSPVQIPASNDYIDASAHLRELYRSTSRSKLENRNIE
jgi:hypothetical protein